MNAQPVSSTDSAKQAAALRYARRGWAVMPLWSTTGAVCECMKGSDCRTPGKHPRIKEWQRDATTDPRIIGRWWTKWRSAGVGILTGAQSGLVVIDVDPRHAGEDTLAALEAKHGRLPETVMSLTGGGGRHLLFKHPGGTIGNDAGAKLGPGLDIKADGGQIVAPPTVHASGRAYCWNAEAHLDDVEVAELPEWAVTVLWASAPKERKASEQRDAKIAEGGRSDALASLAGSMRRRGMSETAILAALRVVNREQCLPPLDDDEVAQIAESVAAYKPDAPPWLAPEEPAGVVDPGDPWHEEEPRSAGPELEDEAATTQTGDDWPTPIPFDAIAVPEFPVDTLPGPLRALVEAVSIATRTPVDLAGCLSLAAVSATIARRFEVLVKPGWTEPTNVYIGPVLAPAHLKSPVLASRRRGPCSMTCAIRPPPGGCRRASP